MVKMPTIPGKGAVRGTIAAMEQSDRSVRHKTVGAIMTKDLVTLDPEDHLLRALEIMRRHRIRRLPVVAGDRLVGLLTEGDVKRAQPSILLSNQDEFNRVMESTPVSRVMIRKVVTVSADTPLLEAARMLRETKYGTLPVLEAEKLIGIITDADCLKVLIDLLAAEE